MALVATALVAAGLGCASSGSGIGPLRYVNAPIAQRVADDRPVPKPEASTFLPGYYHLNQLFYLPADRILAVPRYHRARNVNALGEVPDSTWFENRLNGGLSKQEVQRGSMVDDGPDLSRPLTVLSSKAGGKQVGFIVQDQRGVRYLLKFDRKGVPVAETAANVVANRLLWALGYRVPADSVVTIAPGGLVLDDDATIPGFAGRDVPLTRDKLEEALAQVNHNQDGTIRALASRFLPGKPLGGFPQQGTRDDDPNDAIPHEQRRELRGMYVFYSWLKSTDMKTDNTLDMWEKKGDGELGVVHHYLLDFGMSLGVNGLALRTRGDGYERFFSITAVLTRSLTFGLWGWHFEDLPDPGVPHVGIIETRGYHPDEYVTRVHYMPWKSRDRFDSLWAARLLARLKREHIEGAVAAARYPDPRTARFVVDALWERRRIAIRHHFRGLAAIDEIEVDGSRLCFVDLGVRHGVQTAASYSAKAFDFGGRRVGPRLDLAQDGERYCASSVPMGKTERSYTIVRIRGRRGGRVLPAIDVHIARGPDGFRVIGVRRH